MLTAKSGTPYRKLMVPSSGSTTHWMRAAGAVVPPSSPRMPASGVCSSRSRLTRASAPRSVSVTTSVGEDLLATGSGRPYAELTNVAAARAICPAMRSSSAGSGAVPRSGTVDGDSVARQELDGLHVGAGVGDQHVELIELRKAEHLDVAELGLVDQGNDAMGPPDHRPLERVLLTVRGSEPMLERESVAADEERVDDHVLQLPASRLVDHRESLRAHGATEHGEVSKTTAAQRERGDERIGDHV